MKYKCPKCQSQLKYWNEFMFHKERTINKYTGKLNKKITKSKELELEQHGLKCTKCDFEYYGNVSGNSEVYKHLDYIFENYTGMN